MSERALSTSVDRIRSVELEVAGPDVSPVQRRLAIGTGPMPTLPNAIAPSSALPIQMFADAVGAGVHARVVQLDGSGGGLSAQDVHRAAAHGLSGAGGSLPHLAVIQQAFGRHDVTGVRAHVGGVAAEGAAAMGARAYASGSSVAFASSPDLHLAAHEATHIVQQRGGVQLSGGVGAAGDAYEVHADAVADRVVRGESAEALLDQYAPSGGVSDGVQRAVQRDEGELGGDGILPSHADLVRHRIAELTTLRDARSQLAILHAVEASHHSIVERVRVPIVGTDRVIEVAPDELAGLVRLAEERVATLTVELHGVSLEGLEGHMPPDQLAQLRELCGRYAFGAVASIDTLAADLERLGALVRSIDGPMDPLAQASLRQVATTMRIGLAALQDEASGTIGPDDGSGLSAEEARARTLAPLTAMRGGPFAALFYLVVLARTGNREEANRAAVNGSFIDSVAGSLSSVAEGIEAGHTVDPPGHAADSPTVVGVDGTSPPHMPTVDAAPPVSPMPGRSALDDRARMEAHSRRMAPRGH